VTIAFSDTGNSPATGAGLSGAEDPTMRLVDAVFAEPRLKAVAACGTDSVVLRADVPTDGGALTPTLVCYRRDPAAGWHPEWTVGGATEAASVSGGFAYVRRGGDGQLVAFRTADGSAERILHDTAGRVVALAPKPNTDELVCTVALPGRPGDQPGGLLAGSDAVWYDGPDAALGNVRRPEGRWQVWALRTTGEAARPLDTAVPPGTALTGEAAWARSALLLGISRHRPDGSRRFGLLAVTTTGGPPRPLLYDGIDLCYPVQAPDGHAVAYLATSVPENEEPLIQFPCLVLAGSLDVRVLEAPNDTWQRPCGWDSPTRLVCTAEEGPRRHLYEHDLAAARWRRIPTSASVDSARVGAAGAAVVVSALDSPPTAQVLNLHSGTAETVETTQLPALPGRLHYRPQKLAKVTAPLASWLCLPDSGPARGTVALFHGGPFKSWTEWAWRWNPWPFVACNYAVILVEPPMSLGYNSAVAIGWRRWRTGIAAAAAEQVEQLRTEAGLAHTALALMGGSFGGYLALTTAAALHPRLVVAHAAPLDLAHVAAASDVGWQWVREYGDPDGKRSHYAQQSLPPHPVPAGTRVLLSHGIHDELVPPTETLRLHRSLIRDGARSEVAFFTSEAHPLSRPMNIRAWYRWTLAACQDELSDHAQKENA